MIARMSNKGKKLQPKFGLDMSFNEAIARFIRADPGEVDALVKRGKRKKPPGSKRRKPSGGTSQSETVVSLRRRRMRKRDTGR